jgi:hypothetical protein
VIGETARALTPQGPAGDTLYVNAEAGADTNSGTRDKPLRTLAEAANRVNAGKGTGPTTVIVAEGLHLLDRTVLFKPGLQYTAGERLTIRAESLPDDPDWTPARMPVLLPVMPLSKTWMGRPDPFGGVAYGILDSYGCGLWTTQPGDDFEFHNNVISGSQYAWIREASRHRYRVTDSVFAGNKNLVGSGAGPALNFKTLDPAIMELPKSIPVVDKPVQVEMDETKRKLPPRAGWHFGERPLRWLVC